MLDDDLLATVKAKLASDDALTLMSASETRALIRALVARCQSSQDEATKPLHVKIEQVEAENKRLRDDWASINGDIWQDTLNENKKLRAFADEVRWQLDASEPRPVGGQQVGPRAEAWQMTPSTRKHLRRLLAALEGNHE